MKTLIVETVPRCQRCGAVKDEIYDVPLIISQWAYLCQDCRPGSEAPFADMIGTKLIKQENHCDQSEG